MNKLLTILSFLAFAVLPCRADQNDLKTVIETETHTVERLEEAIKDNTLELEHIQIMLMRLAKQQDNVARKKGDREWQEMNQRGQ